MNMADQNTVKIPGHRLGIALALGGFLFSVMVTKPIAGASLRQGEPTRRSLTPLQLEIEKQEQRLRSTDVEERRDAVMRLGAIRRPEASRAAASALHDASPIVRATASAAVLWLPGEERATALIPLLKDKDEFVRQESAYALGPTRSKAQSRLSSSGSRGQKMASGALRRLRLVRLRRTRQRFPGASTPSAVVLNC